MKRLICSLFLCIPLLSAGLFPAGVEADSSHPYAGGVHWTRCTLHYNGHGGFLSKSCVHYPIHTTRTPIGHWWKEIAHTPTLSVRVTYPTFQRPVDMGSRAVSCAWQWRGLIAEASNMYGVPTRVIAATLCTESTGSNIGCNVSTDGYGSEGLLQLLPSTAAFVMGVSVSYAASALCNPGWNILAGAKYLSMQYRTFGYSWRAAAGAYNAGSWVNYAYLTKWPYGWDYYYFG